MMIFERSLFDAALILIAVLALLSTLLTIRAVPHTHELRRTGPRDGMLVAGAIVLAGLVAFIITGAAAGAALAGVFVLMSCAVVRAGASRLSHAGVLEMGLGLPASVVATAWTWLLLREQGFPPWALWGLGVAGVVGLACFGLGFAVRLVDDAIFTHGRWTRPVKAPPSGAATFAPTVSVHVPCYAEPPEVVIATLRSLARMPYPNFEVIVCDNNTPDEALWRPVQQFCATLNARPGPRFHFHHVAPLQGAKAGALNYCLQHTGKDVDLVAVVDADYLAEPDFLCRLTGYFADPQIGFVQTPHDYRPDGSAYQAMCYWEYMPPNRIGLAGLNEYDCAYTIGTMCILRRAAIEAAGGWAEWCLTEDSEISIRIRALGYRGVYVNETFGRGLIPESFQDYKKQRFRWTAGPVQQVLTHWRLFLPVAMGGSRKLSGWVKLMETHRGLSPVLGVCGVLLGGAAAIAGGVLTLQGRLPRVDLPSAFWVAAAFTTTASLARLWHRYRLTGSPSLANMLGGEAARLSLSLVKMTAALAPLGGRPLQWLRTPKFPGRSSLARALAAAAPETILALTFAGGSAVAVALAPELGGHVSLLAMAGCLAASGAFLAAPVLALAGELRLRRGVTAAASRDLARKLGAPAQKAA